MSVKYFDKESGQWIAYTSNFAYGIRVLDTEGNFVNLETGIRSETVEEALKFMARDVKDLSERVEYIYENGTIGGGGGGGAVLPTLKLITPFSNSASQDYATVSISSGAKIVSEFTFQSPNIGLGTAYYSITGDKSYKHSVQISQGMNKFDFGEFPTGSYKCNIYVVDAGGLYSNTVTIVVESGSLEISSTFNDAFDFTLADDVSINFTVRTISVLPIVMTYSVDGAITTRELEAGGSYVWNVGRMAHVGVHKLSIKATSGTFVSNELTFNLIVGDTTNMFLASDFSETQILEGRDIVMRYRASMAGETRAVIKKWINGDPQSDDVVMIGTGNYLFWKIGDQLPAGSYVFELQAFTSDGAVFSEKLKFNVEVIIQEFVRIKQVMDDTLIATFIADTKSSSSVTKNIWEDKSGNNVPCQLYDFNHVTNGWDGYSLKFDGRSYAVIDLAPWMNNCTNGFTFDFYYKTQNIGNIDAKVLWMKNNDTPYQGFYVDTQRANITSGNGKIIETFMKDSEMNDEWQHVAFVINRRTQLMEIFVNAVLSKVVRLSQSETFTFDGKIYLGGHYTPQSMTEQGKCSIRAINIYNRALEDEEILQNYISCLPYPDEQERVWRLNYDDQQIPKMDITGNLDGITDDETNTPLVSIDYMDYADKTKSFSLSQCKISIQGTSSKLYPVKNYTIQLRSNGQDFYYTPKNEWIKESRFTLKSNYMDQSNANNICNARFFNDMIRAYHPYPSQIIDPTCRGTVDGFPIQLYVNNTYQGLYTFNVDRYASRTLGFDKTGSCVAYEVSANTNTGAGAFMIGSNSIETWNSIKREFKYRYHFAGDQKIVCDVDASMGNQIVLKDGSYHEELVNLVNWTSEATPEEFRGEINTHWSLNHLIDYFTFIYLVGLVDNFGKNLVITCYSKDVNLNSVFYPLLYDKCCRIL